MRRIVVEHARHRTATKRGGGRSPVLVLDEAASLDQPAADLLDLNSALDTLEARDPRKASVVKLRYFGGLTTDEIAAVLAVSTRTWLSRELSR